MYQLVVKRPIASSIWLEPNRKPGDVVWVRSLQAARTLIEGGFCSWHAEGPTQAAEAGPQETKKSSLETQDGPSTDSATSNQSGAAGPLSASAQVLVSPHRL